MPVDRDSVPSSFASRRRTEARLKGMPWAESSGGIALPWTFRTPTGTVDYAAEVGDLMFSRVVMAYVNWIVGAFPQARFAVEKVGGGRIEHHDLTRLLRVPNPDYSGRLLWAPTLLSWNIAGSAYWRMFWNANRTKVVSLYYRPHYLVRPRRRDGEYLSYYQIWNGRHWEDVPKTDIIHFRNGIDPTNEMLGLSPLGAALREIYTDQEASRFIAALLRNMGVPGLVISPATAEGMIDDIEAMKATVIAKTTGDARGEPLILRVPMNVERLGWSPTELGIDALRRGPEATAGALLRIHPAVVGLLVGLEHSTYSNMQEARAGAWEDNLIPTGEIFAAELETQLLPFVGNPDTETVVLDTTGVQALQEARQRLWAGLTGAYDSGWMRKNEVRGQAGLVIVPTEDGYKAPAPASPMIKMWTPPRLPAGSPATLADVWADVPMDVEEETEK